MSERLTWEEIVEKYPCNSLGLTDVIFKNNDGVHVQSAVVKYDNETMNQLTDRLLCDGEDIFLCHTNPDSCMPLGFLGVDYEVIITEGESNNVYLDLLPESKRPIIVYNDTLILFDTGAEISVWTATPDEFFERFPNAKKQDANVPLKGIAGNVSCPIYNIELHLDKLQFIDLPIVLHEIPSAEYQMIIDTSMLQGLKYKVDTANHMLSIEVGSAEELIRKYSQE